MGETKTSAELMKEISNEEWARREFGSPGNRLAYKDEYSCGDECPTCNGCHHTCKCDYDSAPKRKRAEKELNEMRQVDKQEKRAYRR